MKRTLSSWPRSLPKLIAASFFWLPALALGMCGGSAVEARGIDPVAVDGGRELKCLALNIYFEARSEPEAGKFAVGHVVMNRVAHKRFPKSICRVIRQGGDRRRYRCQFSWWCDGQSDRPRDRAAWRESRRIANIVYVGASEDPTNGALWYHADYVKPDWRNDFQRGPKIGRHVFYAIEDMKRRNAGSMQPDNASTLARPNTLARHEEPAWVKISGDDISNRMLMIFGVGLIGLGLTGLRRKS